jgi:hypothetical protein
MAMSYLSDAHSEWHLVNPDTPWNCPLDCYDPPYDPIEDMTDEELAEYDRWATEQAEQRAEVLEDPWFIGEDPPF